MLEVGAAAGTFVTEEPADLTRDLVELEDGFGLHIVSRNTQPTPDEARRPILGYARTVTRCADL
ncbi:hypothetical protein ACFC96_05905 [Streptomyces sp. NPDC055955]|uniref:hypothetical protein n=1 Tax=Streptomyces sp. NPDC055955 TaxID=3345665 RepID=UPI0035E0C9D2